ncbi:MAG TPA: pentapeptide repeat-containing protein, partial [Myxococcaceae bacterium]|nr:pentapeptide repeat-containing protein [Myxococcaceae bacterium]
NAAADQAPELPPFRPQDSPGVLLQRALRDWGEVPGWLLDAPGLRPPLPPVVPAGQGLEAQLREAVRARLEGRKPTASPDTVGRAQTALRMASREAAAAALLLKEVGVEPLYRFAPAKGLKAALRAEVEIDDLTGSLDPRVTGALWVLQLPQETAELSREARRRLSAAHLFTALTEAGFYPDNNWEEALESSEPSLELANAATGGDREALAEGFNAFAALPEEARLRRLAYLAEATFHLEQLGRLPEGVEPRWLHDPEFREHHEREMLFVEALSAQDIPGKVSKLAAEQLGVPEGTVPEDSEGDLFLHFRCSVCGEEKLLVQSP